MKHEFTKIKNGNETHYVLENASAGGTSSGAVASVSTPLGGVRRRSKDNILAQEGDKPAVPASKPRNFVAKNAKMGGAGQHRDKKKEQKQGKEKHRKPFAEQGVAEDHEIQMASSELQAIAKNAVHLLDLVRKYSEAEGLEAWQQSKITKAADYLNSVLQSISGEQSALESQINEYETHTYKDSQGNVWRVDDEGNKELVRGAPGSSYGGSRYSSRYPRRPAYNKPRGMYFFNVPPDKEDDARNVGLRQTKSGKWYDTMSNQKAVSLFGQGRWWEPKSEGVAEEGFGPAATAALKQGKSPSEVAYAATKDNQNMAQSLKIQQQINKGEDPTLTAAGNAARKAGNVKVEQGVAEVAPKGWEGTVKAMKKHKDIDNPWALANWMKGKGYKSHKEDAYMQELADKLGEKLDPNAEPDVWVQDFQKADPNKYHQFRNKTPEKKAQMAISARYAARQPKSK